jgi:dihydroflavonol-4-reductase
MGEAAARVSTRQLPNWMVRVGALFSPQLRQLVPQLGIARQASSEKARRVLGWTPRSNEAALLATAESLVRFGLVEPKQK